MKSKKTHWAILALVAFTALILAAYVLPPLPKTKARASRITTVNNISSFSKTSANAPATVTPSK